MRICSVSLALLASLALGFSASSALAQLGGGGGGPCDPEVELCGPICPPDDPDCGLGVPDELDLLIELAKSCQPGDLTKKDIREMRALIIQKMVEGEIKPRGAQGLHQKLMGCL